MKYNYIYRIVVCKMFIYQKNILNNIEKQFNLAE